MLLSCPLYLLVGRTMELFNYLSGIKPAAGRLLVSEPLLPDPNFERSVILLCAHDEEGSFGFVLNKPAGSMVGELVEWPGEGRLPVYIGGPVQQDTLQFLHCFNDLEGAKEVLPGVYWGGDFEALRERAMQGRVEEEQVRFFLGYSGWSAGQVEDELKENAWIVSDQVDHGLIFRTEPEEMWHQVLLRMGGRFARFANYPQDPRLN